MGGLAGSTAAFSAGAQDTPPSIVEDFSYPGAADILAQYNVKLISGDGHILFADCTTPPVNDIGVIKVYTTEQVGVNGAGLVCFRVLASSGHLELEVPGVYEIRGDGQRSSTGHKLTAIVRTDAGQLPPVTVNPSGSTQVGIGANPNNPPTTLLQLVVAP
ncbi:MAG TPA: hypothetical protein VJT31_22700 [Rugosimonospora sp.]|nr:hypothetical protein [Rugosimonospora sp.]